MAEPAGVNDFRRAKRLFKRQITKLVRRGEPTPEMKSSALPAYAHRNPVIDYVFWRRVSVACSAVLAHGSREVLDFGCGIGFTAYLLAGRGTQVTAVDTELAPLNAIRETVSFPDTIRFLQGDLRILPLSPGSFDAIVALNVLEHIEDLDDVLRRLRELLRPDGIIVVSGPTESSIYRLGRRLAGRHFTGDYHVSSVRHVRNSMARSFEIRPLARLLWPMTLYEIFTATPRD